MSDNLVQRERILAARLAVAARIFHFLDELLQCEVPGRQKWSSAVWTLLHSWLASAADIVAAFAECYRRKHVLSADWAFQLHQKAVVEVISCCVLEENWRVSRHIWRYLSKQKRSALQTENRCGDKIKRCTNRNRGFLVQVLLICRVTKLW